MKLTIYPLLCQNNCVLARLWCALFLRTFHLPEAAPFLTAKFRPDPKFHRHKSGVHGGAIDANAVSYLRGDKQRCG